MNSIMKNKKRTDKILLPYSEAAPDDLRPLVQALQAPDAVADFCGATTLSDEGVRQWLEAYRHPVTGLWMLDRHTAMPGLMRRQENVFSHICFFDAIYYCAWFEQSARGLKQSLEQAAGGDSIYFRDLAESVGVPFDMDGLPHPVFNGRSLTPGDFDDHAQEVMKAAAGKIGTALTVLPRENKMIELTAKGAESLALRLLSSEDILSRSVTDFEKKAEKEKRKKEKFKSYQKKAAPLERVVNKLEKTIEALEIGVERSFLSYGTVPVFFTFNEVSPVIPEHDGVTLDALLKKIKNVASRKDKAKCFGNLSFVAPFMIPAFTYRCIRRPDQYLRGSNPNISLTRYFNVRCAALEKAAEKLPNDEKKVTQAFLKAARTVYFLEYAAALAARAQEMKDQGEGNAGRYRKLLEEGACRIEEAATLSEKLSSEETERLKVLLYKGKFAEPGTFLKALTPQADELKSLLRKRAEAIIAGP